MTTFMTFSVYSLRISQDMPVESNFVPMVTLYFILGISYTFLSLIWFIIANDFITKNYLPKYLTKFALIIKRVLYRKISPEPDENANDLVEVKVVPNQSANENAHESGLPPLKNAPKLECNNNRCNNCDFCVNCKREKEKSANKSKKKELNESNVLVLNYFMCFLMGMIILACNLISWLLISNPPIDY